MNSDPTELNGVRQCGFELIGNESACVPTRASVQKVEDDLLVDEQEVTLDLHVGSVRNIHTAHVVWAKFGPHAAHLTGVTYFWHQVEDFIRNRDPLEKAAHHKR